MACPVCGRIPPQETFKYCPVCGHRFGDPVPAAVALTVPVPATAAPAPPRLPGPVRPAPTPTPGGPTYGVTDAPARIDGHTIDAGQPVATTAEGDRLWVVRNVPAGYETIHSTWQSNTGEIGGGASEEYRPASLSVLLETPHGDGRLVAHVTFAPDDATRILHITELTLRRWSPGRVTRVVPDEHLQYLDDATQIRTMVWTKDGVPLAPDQLDEATTGSSSPWRVPTDDESRVYDRTVDAIHTCLVALPASPWLGYALSHDAARYEGVRSLRL